MDGYNIQGSWGKLALDKRRIAKGTSAIHKSEVVSGNTRYWLKIGIALAKSRNYWTKLALKQKFWK